MSVYADSSFLASLYLIDGNFAAADQFMRATGAALPLTSFGAFELKNAIRGAVVRRTATEAEARRVLALIQRDTGNGLLVPTTCDWEAVYSQAESLSDHHTMIGGHRALDVLHVAAAWVLGHTDFLTFDQRQSELARQAGLTVHP